MESAREWVVCKNTEYKTDPRVSTPCRIVIVDNEKEFDNFNKNLIKTGEYAFALRSYEKYFSGRTILGNLPRSNM